MSEGCETAREEKCDGNQQIPEVARILYNKLSPERKLLLKTLFLSCHENLVHLWWKSSAGASSAFEAGSCQSTLAWLELNLPLHFATVVLSRQTAATWLVEERMEQLNAAEKAECSPPPVTKKRGPQPLSRPVGVIDTAKKSRFVTDAVRQLAADAIMTQVTSCVVPLLVLHFTLFLFSSDVARFQLSN